MRHWGFVALAGLVSGCGADVVTAPDMPGGASAAQELACAVAVADHAGLPLDAVRPEWTGTTDTGTDIFFVHHGDTLHTCEVGADGQVLELQHPQE